MKCLMPPAPPPPPPASTSAQQDGEASHQGRQSLYEEAARLHAAGASITHIAAEFGATLRHYNPEENAAFRDLVATLPATDRFPSIVYTRLVLDRLLRAFHSPR